jgi:hypothetical protein
MTYLLRDKWDRKSVSLMYRVPADQSVSLPEEKSVRSSSGRPRRPSAMTGMVRREDTLVSTEG